MQHAPQDTHRAEVIDLTFDPFVKTLAAGQTTPLGP